MTCVLDHDKALLAPLRAALMQGKPDAIQRAIMDAFTPDAQIRLCFPFQDVKGPIDLCERVYAPLLKAVPDIYRWLGVDVFARVADLTITHRATENAA
jgi:hypothetical protein